jgi:hypothetical protein
MNAGAVRLIAHWSLSRLAGASALIFTAVFISPPLAQAQFVQQAKLVGTGAVGPYGAGQGASVALSADGTTAILGGPFDNFITNQGAVGAVWVVTRSNGVWIQ